MWRKQTVWGRKMTNHQIQFYQNKLEFEIDPSDLFALLSASEPVVVVDVRSAAAHQEEHIPGALNVPHRSMTEESVAGFDRRACASTPRQCHQRRAPEILTSQYQDRSC